MEPHTILKNYSDREKGAYLAALASLATADRSANSEEIDHLRELARNAGLSEQQEKFIIDSASDVTGEDLKKCLDILKSSDLRYSLITDLMALAKADESYSDEEKQHIERIAKYLNVDSAQVSVLDQFVSKAADHDANPEEVMQPGFLDKLGMRDQFSRAGLNPGAGRSIFGMLGPLLLGGLAAKALGGGRRSGGFGSRGAGGALGGGLLGGALGGMLGGPMGGLGGGLGSILGGLNKSRNNRSFGGMLGRLL